VYKRKAQQPVEETLSKDDL
jgi:hypothetical protein